MNDKLYDMAFRYIFINWFTNYFLEKNRWKNLSHFEYQKFVLLIGTIIWFWCAESSLMQASCGEYTSNKNNKYERK